MKFGDKIEISENAKYSGIDMEWTEGYAGKYEEWLEAGSMLFHFSNHEIKSFFPKETCFLPKPILNEHCYMFIIKEKTYSNWYNAGEYRIDLRYANIDIYYMGELTKENRMEMLKKMDIFRKSLDIPTIIL